MIDIATAFFVDVHDSSSFSTTPEGVYCKRDASAASIALPFAGSVPRAKSLDSACAIGLNFADAQPQRAPGAPLVRTLVPEPHSQNSMAGQET
jgi:hypothetical protein